VFQAEDMWEEVTATNILLAEASPDVRYWKFTKRQESAVGADWLWWWIDTTGTSFGLLTQAKVLKRHGTGWRIDFGYRRKKTEPTQIDKLIAASMRFSVPAAHVLYCGTPTYRVGLNCGLAHPEGANCRDRERAGVSIVPSIVPQYFMPRMSGNVAAMAFHWSLPLEDVADLSRPQPPLRPLAAVHPDITEFMRHPQVGARRVAKTMLEAVHSIRMGQFSAALLDEACPGRRVHPTTKRSRPLQRPLPSARPRRTTPPASYLRPGPARRPNSPTLGHRRCRRDRGHPRPRTSHPSTRHACGTRPSFHGTAPDPCPVRRPRAAPGHYRPIKRGMTEAKDTVIV
jgi:hypothetical protein